VLRIQLQDNATGILPHQIVLKLKDRNHGDSFAREREFYERFSQLQGQYIPRFYGIATVDCTEALVLSDVGGITLMDESMPNLSKEELERNLRNILRPIRDAGVKLEDVSLFNIHYTEDGRVIALDFEEVETDLPCDEATVERDVESQVGDLVKDYQLRQKGIQALKTFRLDHQPERMVCASYQEPRSIC
jgi:RIO-like serine/threonine protein kinase